MNRKINYLQLLGLLPLRGHDVLAVEAGLLHEEALEVAAALEEDLEAGALHPGAVVDTENLRVKLGRGEILS